MRTGPSPLRYSPEDGGDHGRVSQVVVTSGSVSQLVANLGSCRLYRENYIPNTLVVGQTERFVDEGSRHIERH